MKLNDDGKTVRGMDVLFPKIGEIIGGSEREADYDKLVQRAQEVGVPEKDLWWYLTRVAMVRLLTRASDWALSVFCSSSQVWRISVMSSPSPVRPRNAEF